MDMESIHSTLEAERFEPLRISFATGLFCDVTHPDSIFIHDGQLLILERTAPGGRDIQSYRFVEPQLISDIVPVRLAGSRPPADELGGAEILLPAERFLNWFESLLALMATILICGILALFGIAFYAMTRKGDLAKDAMAILAWAVVIALEVMLAVRIARFCTRRLYPLPLLYALNQEPPQLMLTRWVFSLIWLAHGLAGVLAFAWSDLFFTATNYGRSRNDRMVEYVLLLLFVSAGAHASMMFFLLATRSAGATPRIVRRLWRFRVLIDLCIVGSVMLFPRILTALLEPLNILGHNLRFLTGR